jgi:hypothetical protein
LISEVVRSFVDQKQMFTAFEVTVAVQKKGIDEDLWDDDDKPKHKALRNDIHDEINTFLASGEYSRVLADVGAPHKAFVFYPAGGDPDQYVNPLTPSGGTKTKSSDIAYVPKDPPSATTGTTSPSTARTRKQTVRDRGKVTDRRGCLCVPSKLVRSLGWKSFAHVFAVKGTMSGKNIMRLKIHRGNKVPPRQVGRYTIDKGSNIRIAPGALQKAGMRDGQYKFKAQKGTDSIVVSMA